MSKLALISTLLLLLSIHSIYCKRMVNSNNVDKVIELFYTFADTFFQKYHSLYLKNMSDDYHFTDMKYEKINLTLTPQNSDEQEISVYNGKLIVSNLSFNLENIWIPLGQQNEIMNIQMPILEISFELYSNPSFISIDNTRLNEENELYNRYTLTIQQLFNMAIMKTLGPIYHAFNAQQIDPSSFVPNFLKMFEDYFVQYHGEKMQPESKFIFDVSKYLNRQSNKKYQDVYIESAEDLEKLSVQFKVPTVKAKVENQEQQNNENSNTDNNNIQTNNSNNLTSNNTNSQEL
ncbi:hypothetical protein TTHERM_00112360 (macronuclear) [Tetrahymena thermophila SB210]|uniref:Transmembrane protein n=1 Tax=Tetrahymena thermophila (strain SB210) TaxID=312017 RepID=Q22ZD5_TETTS|nr:hypothetical protein TTHERM_00112360 [Tetrahymena thermophila SB210]EAR90386.2 hypothetical protein TTHERM_00112360 [Tetrahymena thermophila SB210]|eukprot:XP_001010631.2 hypothetical protein TTHERM_00112360 [Tetrahymena thermophila SB210]